MFRYLPWENDLKNFQQNSSVSELFMFIIFILYNYNVVYVSAIQNKWDDEFLKAMYSTASLHNVEWMTR